MFRLIVLSSILAFANSATVLTEGDPTPSHSRVVGGYPTSIRRVPYLVSLQIKGSPGGCAGVLITPLHVLTSAQCTVGIAAGDLAVRVGSETLSAGGTLVSVARIIAHPAFDPSSNDYDIALLVLNSPQFFTNKFPRLPRCRGRGAFDRESKSGPRDDRCYSHLDEGQWALTAGWGDTLDGEETHELRAVLVPIVSNEECNDLYDDLGGVSYRMLCAGDVENGGIDACYGDSGAPLMLGRTLIGLVSWGDGCGLPGRPGVYTRISSVTQWIIEKVLSSLN